MSSFPFGIILSGPPLMSVRLNVCSVMGAEGGSSDWRHGRVNSPGWKSVGGVLHEEIVPSETYCHVVSDSPPNHVLRLLIPFPAEKRCLFFTNATGF